jgi:hypothetical protein
MKLWTGIGLAAILFGMLAVCGCPPAETTSPPTPGGEAKKTPQPATAEVKKSPQPATAEVKAPPAPAPGEAKTYSFDSKEALASWTVTGDVTVDPAKSREGKGGSLKIGPGGKAVLKLRNKDGAGKVDLWVFDDGTSPANPKVGRAGPRWAVAQADGKKQTVVSILYQSYIGGNEGYTAVLFTGQSWFSNLAWLGVNRAPAGWHRWTFDFDPDKGMKILHNGKAVDDKHFPVEKVGINGFSSIVLYGDDGKGDGSQTFWVADLSVTLGGDMKVAAAPAPSPAPTPAPAAVQRPAAPETPKTTPPVPGEAKTYSFNSKEDLSGWTVTGDVTVDPAKSREGKGGSLKIGPGGKAVLKLRDKDGAGKVDLWVFDDGTKPADAKAARTGPRWAVAGAGGKQTVLGILYQAYIGGAEGYTATLFSGGGWYSQIAWLGVNRAPAGWHRWTFNFDAEKGMSVLHNGKAVDDKHFPADKVGINGFNSVVLYGDGGKGDEQTFWVADVSVTLGGDMKTAPAAAPAASPAPAAAPATKAAAAPLDFWKPSDQKVAIYTKANPPATPKLDDLPLKETVTQWGITWTFDKPAHVGQFINGDFYVVGPVTVVKIDPKPLYGNEIADSELDHMDKEKKVEERVRNGFMLNPPSESKVSYDSGIRNYFTPSLIQKLPVAMKAGDSLVSTISMPKGLILKSQLWYGIERGVEDSSPVRTAAVLTCVAEPLAPDAFRPSFCDRKAKIYYSRDLKREMLPSVAAPKDVPDVRIYVRFTERPWVATCFFGFEEPVENMPQYGRDFSRVVGFDALLLCTDLKPEQKEPLLVDFVQVGIDHAGMVRGGHPGWEGFGGHGSGRKLPIVFAGLLLGDDEIANVNKSFPKLPFGEDEQTAYGDAWNGAKVVFTGHRAIDERTGIARTRTGPYEQKVPKNWTGGDKTSESYRRCCTSAAWVSQALALHLLKAEAAWNHPAFFDYCDRWMFEDETEALKTMEKDAGLQEADWAREGQTWEKWVNELWGKNRSAPGMPPTDGWKQQHDDSYLKNAMAK